MGNATGAAAPHGPTPMSGRRSVAHDDHRLPQQAVVDRSDRQFLAPVAATGDGHDAAHLVAQREAAAERRAPVEKGFTQRSHIAKVDGRSDDQARHLRIGQLGHQPGKVVLLAGLQRDPGGELTGNAHVRQLDQLGLNVLGHRSGRFQADPQRGGRRLAFAGTATDAENRDGLSSAGRGGLRRQCGSSSRRGGQR